MRLMQRETSVTGEPGYDAGMLRKVAALAARLQSQKRDTLTAQEVEAIAAEVELDAPFVRQALEMIMAGPAKSARSRIPRGRLFWDMAILLLSLLGGLLVYLYPAHQAGILLAFVLLTWSGCLLYTAVILQNPKWKVLSWFLGSMCIMLLVELAPLFGLGSVRGADVLWAWVLMPALSLLGGRLGVRWVWARKRATRSRAALIEQMLALQRQLDAHKQYRAFLSVDVVGSSEMKRSAQELAVERSFGRYRTWVEDDVRAHGGEMQSAAGDGVMAIFPTDAGAVRAARQLQEELPRFNQEQNRLPQPFRIRYGVSAGEVAIDEGTPLGHLQSPVIDRAAALQKRAQPGDIVVSGELAAAALTELGALAPLPEPVAGEPAYSWRAGSSAISSA